MKEIRIGHLSTSYHTCFILMALASIEDKIGVKTHWRLFPTGPEIVKAFQSNELDIGYIGLPPAMIGINKGLKIKCVAGGHVEGTVLTGRKEYQTLDEIGNIKQTLAQFRGKLIGTPTRGSIHDVIIRKLINEAGLRDEVTVKNFKWADFILDAIVDGEVDGGCGTPPLASLASSHADAKIIVPPSVMWPYNPSYGIVATEHVIENSDDILEIFLKHHEDACNLIREKPQEAAELVSKATQDVIEKDFAFDTYRISPKYCASLPKEYIVSTLAFIDTMTVLGYITKPLKMDDVFNTRTVKKIHPGKHHYDNPGALQ